MPFQREDLAVGLRAELDRPTSRTRVIVAGALPVLTTMFSNSLASSSRPVMFERVLERLPCRRRRRADLAGGHLLALLLQRLDHVLRRQAARLQLVRIEPDAHRILPGAEHA